MRTLVDFQCFENLRSSKFNVEEVTRIISNRENSMIVKLAQEASRDASAMRSLTLISSIFLPASFVAVSFHILGTFSTNPTL